MSFIDILREFNIKMKLRNEALKSKIQIDFQMMKETIKQTFKRKKKESIEEK